jgi:hypothetical protein
MANDNYNSWVIHRIKSRSIVRDNGCIEYQGNNGHKYGLISITRHDKRILVPAHRAMYMAVNNCFDLPGSTQIRHKCDNPRCINIEHLLPGTAKENAQDMIERGRKAKKYKLHTRHRIHDDDKIRAIRKANGLHRQIAEQFGVSIGYVSKIKRGQSKTLV